jgi:DNA-directed RNA polymerase specialized sigma subunit
MWAGVRNYTNEEIREKINSLIHSERDRKLMERRLIDGITQEALAEEFDLSVRQVQRIIYKSQKILFL